MLRNFARSANSLSRTLNLPIALPWIAGSSIKRYHTYPDPDDKGVHTSAMAKELNFEKKILDKSGEGFVLDPKFKIMETFPGVPNGKKIEAGNAPKTMHTVLDSGLTVASQDKPGLMTSLAFMVGSGSSYEVQDGSSRDNTGVTQLLELTAFKSTSTRGTDDITNQIAQLGGMVQCITTRENMLYCVDVLRNNLEPALDILADAILRPVYTDDEVNDAKTVARLMVEEMPSDMLSRDAAQRAAYQGSPLGNSHFCPIERIDKLNAEHLRSFHKEFFVGPNCFITAAGVDHGEFVSLVKERFANMPVAKVGETRKSFQSRRAPSRYTGGLVTSERGLKEPFVKVAVSFEVGGWSDKDIIPKCVLNQLLGGGSSFSAGGPGKGMYTRLYTQVLSQYTFIESMEAFISLNEHLGMLGIDASCPPEYTPHAIRIIVDQLVNLAVEPVLAEELSRAKNMCKSMMLMQLESRVVLCEDIARQFVTYGHRKTPAEVCALIDSVTAEDLQRVADELIDYAPSVGCVGHDLSHVPSLKDINEFLQMYVKEARKIKQAKMNKR